VAAAILAALGVLLFGALHAAIIVPIWQRLLGGIPFSFLAAAALTWMYTELRRTGFLRSSLAHAIAFGFLVWLSLLPATLLGAALRLTGLHRNLGVLEDVLFLGLGAMTGTLLGHFFRLPLRLQIAASVSVVILVLAMAGPIPVSNGRRPLLLFLGFLPLYVLASAALLMINRRLGLEP
jgi:hypothetical protein